MPFAALNAVEVSCEATHSARRASILAMKINEHDGAVARDGLTAIRALEAGTATLTEMTMALASPRLFVSRSQT